MTLDHSKLVKGRVYKTVSRNLQLAVYDGAMGFIGIRQKFANRYLFTEYCGEGPYGTVRAAEDTGVDVPAGVQLVTDLGTVDQVSRRPMEFDRPVKNGGRGWFFTDDGSSANDARPVNVHNDQLFDFLDQLTIS